MGYKLARVAWWFARSTPSFEDLVVGLRALSKLYPKVIDAEGTARWLLDGGEIPAWLSGAEASVLASTGTDGPMIKMPERVPPRLELYAKAVGAAQLVERAAKKHPELRELASALEIMRKDLLPGLDSNQEFETARRLRLTGTHDAKNHVCDYRTLFLRMR